jgi:hypothetical protein
MENNNNNTSARTEHNIIYTVLYEHGELMDLFANTYVVVQLKQTAKLKYLKLNRRFIKCVEITNHWWAMGWVWGWGVVKKTCSSHVLFASLKDVNLLVRLIFRSERNWFRFDLNVFIVYLYAHTHAHTRTLSYLIFLCKWAARVSLFLFLFFPPISHSSRNVQQAPGLRSDKKNSKCIFAPGGQDVAY